MHTQTPKLTDQEFFNYQDFIFKSAGIALSESKKLLVISRLAKRLRHYNLNDFSEYFKILKSGKNPKETQIAIDLLTTNETYFFREQKHFDFLRRRALFARGRGTSFRVWSAASSSGEEAYSIAMVLADCLGEDAHWEVLGSDISASMLDQARHGHYAIRRCQGIPDHYLEKFCRIGTDEYQGTLLIDRKLRNRVTFFQLNLNDALPEIGLFDVVFLRNILIYFNEETRRSVVKRVSTKVKSDGHFFIGHTESLSNNKCNCNCKLKPLAPAIYQKDLHTA